MWTWNPFNIFGRFDKTWAGWVYAVDADTGIWKWRLKSNYPIIGGLTPTAAASYSSATSATSTHSIPPPARELWGQDLGGTIGGGVITYTAGGAQGCRRGWLYQHHPGRRSPSTPRSRAWPRQQVRGLVMQFDPVFCHGQNRPS
jgi:hypothetical protein